ncbi:GntR family transcriptional regulator [Nesterenkonia xinjiangensis]|uniref:DNA-binding GntR family transcriptional regulator n=1 Tax=Nesterenkonia xinjiangensis TaxID=225327 RepID=A0A7Z0KAE1_9MICC|nr:GntR family transcriptional regulator [Nesterenkonia xinjiangensis]NYJ78200.1 DNA-binding GntR family transcriptional regulator [Nesterenkonia xinjiangensis]
MASSRGRPRIQETADEIVASVLATAGPRVRTSEFSTRRVAELTGLSQAVVSRAFRRIRAGGVDGGWDGVAGGASATPLQVQRVQVSFPMIRVEFRPVAEELRGAVPRPTAFSRRAAALMAALQVSGARDWPIAGDGSLAQREDEAGAPKDAGSAADVVGEHVGGPAGLDAVWRPGRGTWEDFTGQVASLLDQCLSGDDAVPGDLLQQLAARAGRGLHGVDWRRGGPSASRHHSDSESLAVPEYPAPGRASRWLPHAQLSVTEQIAIALRKEIMNAGYRPGDRITAAPLASRLGLGAGTVRAAMRRLADDGLLASGAGGFSVPQVTGADVIDLYAARLHVGMVLLRGCAVQPRHRLLSARLALGAVEAAAREGIGADVDQADLQFQQELADAAGLDQSARSFHALTLRVRMFISVLQLDYTPAVDRIVHDDRRLMAELLAGRAEDAVRIWRGKLDNAVRHMSALAPEAFDAELWARLSRV